MVLIPVAPHETEYFSLMSQGYYLLWEQWEVIVTSKDSMVSWISPQWYIIIYRIIVNYYLFPVLMLLKLPTAQITSETL